MEHPMTLEQFHDELASASPAPGGGSAAAMAGALGAALVAMVARLTIGRKNYQEVNAEFENLLPRADALRAELLQLMVHDADAYRRVMDAYQLPKDTDAAKTARADAIQSALQHAANVPLRVAQACAEILEMAQRAAARGNKNAASDAGAGALMAEAGLRAALLNVEINLGLIQDERFVARLRAEIQPLEQRAAQRQAILDTVHTRL
ncbi:cyclodeaminase/cyclohydrolase family protein [Anaerolineae bacterium CFX7]|nr:cyclodeaminase/cyclohydrolase family protein [Anaerolineae bacterium CFX7]